MFVTQLCFHSFHVVLSLVSHLHMCEHITCGFLIVQAFRSVGKTMTFVVKLKAPFAFRIIHYLVLYSLRSSRCRPLGLAKRRQRRKRMQLNEMLLKWLHVSVVSCKTKPFVCSHCTKETYHNSIMSDMTNSPKNCPVQPYSQSWHGGWHQCLSCDHVSAWVLYRETDNFQLPVTGLYYSFSRTALNRLEA